MDAEDFEKLFEDATKALLDGARSVAVLGASPVAERFLQRLEESRLSPMSIVVYTDADPLPRLATAPVRPFAALRGAAHDLLVVAGDDDKEALLDAALPYIDGKPRVVLAGYKHFKFRDPIFDEELSRLEVPSLANGYPDVLIHVYQCMANAARLGLKGVVAEFGMFRGGTTMFLSRIAERLGQDWRVIGFDTFAGFPARRTVLDMYDHPDCVWRDIDAVRRYMAGRRVSMVVGDVVDTCKCLADEDVVVSFVDTDNYSSARAVIDVIGERTVVGGAIVFDHFTGRNRFRYTLGERMAARMLLDDSRYLHLHDTGVFYRQR